MNAADLKFPIVKFFQKHFILLIDLSRAALYRDVIHLAGTTCGSKLSYVNHGSLIRPCNE